MRKNVYVFNVKPCSCGGTGEPQHNNEPFDEEPLQSPSLAWILANNETEDDGEQEDETASSDWHTVPWPED
ncbi:MULTISPECIES: hypothetical protein [Rhodopirellula]|uniref:hypothetical protein n=1 Tax=Rhodopirellula TaxID=265488 RepID=UPI00257EF09F|nr:hypothetical protein [Rhodopirellula sp. UBA1907]|tara:strand:+ start:1735 stop:1947 length:213 start_codon:yes stop_codon:yes gene_type:complete